MINYLTQFIRRTYSLQWKLFGKPENFHTFFLQEKRMKFLYTKLLGYDHLGYIPNLQNPKTLNEKLIHRRLFSRDPIWPIVSDKVAARDWIIKKKLHEYVHLIPVHHVFEDPNELITETIEKPFVIKAAWAQAWNIFILDETSDKDQIIATLKKWKATPYRIHRLIWASHQIPRRFIIEKMLTNHANEPPLDFKFLVVHGKVELIQVFSDRFKKTKVAHFNRDKNFIKIKRKKKENMTFTLPSQINQMIIAAEQIGKHFDFVRVDLYLHNKKIYFGEITQTPANGFGPFIPRKFDYELGEKWNYNP
jgi:hypothetical protein